MNARIELLTSPGQSDALPPPALWSCCGPRALATEAPPRLASLLVASVERGLELVVMFAAWSRHALFPRNGAPADAIILK